MVLAERTLPPAHQHHLLPPSISHGPSNETLELLSKWLPVGPISAQDPVAAVVDEEVRLVNSIYELLGEYDYAHTAVQQEMQALKAANLEAQRSNEELRAKLSVQTQRLELSHQQQQQQLQQGTAAMQAQQSPGVSQAVSGVQNTPEYRDGGGMAMQLTPNTLAAASPRTRAGWLGLGFWFTSRPKKRVRNALL